MLKNRTLLRKVVVAFVASVTITTSALALNQPPNPWPGCGSNCQSLGPGGNGCAPTTNPDGSPHYPCFVPCCSCCTNGCGGSGTQAAADCRACCEAYNGGSTGPTAPSHCTAPVATSAQ